RFASKRGIPAPLSATLLVRGSAGLIGFGWYLLSGPGKNLIQDAPQIGYTLAEAIQRLRVPHDLVMERCGQIDNVTDSVNEKGVVKVAVQQPGILSQAAGNMLSIATNAAVAVVLSMFLLASGTMFYEKIVQSFTL